MDNPTRKYTIQKSGKNAGNVTFEFMQQVENCMQVAEEISVRYGAVKSREGKEHFDDDNPVYHDVNLS